jgi:hypothetical protein
MTFPLSRLMSTATATYGVYALANPRHLGHVVDPKNADDYDLLATTYGARDLTISTVALRSRSERAISAAMAIRIACDISDGLILATRTKDAATRQKVFGVTFGWAALNMLALVSDRRRSRKAMQAL